MTQTPRSTGLLKLAKAGYANAQLDTEDDYYSSRIFETPTDDVRDEACLIDEVQLGRYKYRWNDHEFLVYAADFRENVYNHSDNNYIVYPRQDGDIIDGRSQIVDKLITAATQHETQIEEEMWVYDRGYWDKNHNLWKTVQGCSWENVILNKETKNQLTGDIEGFFDREAEYKSLAVPWKVSEVEEY